MREPQPFARPDILTGFAMMPGTPANPSSDRRAARKGRWREADVKRAIAAAEEAGLRGYRVEIAPDGTISIIVGDPPDTAGPASD